MEFRFQGQSKKSFHSITYPNYLRVFIQQTLTDCPQHARLNVLEVYDKIHKQNRQKCPLK